MVWAADGSAIGTPWLRMPVDYWLRPLLMMPASLCVHTALKCTGVCSVPVAPIVPELCSSDTNANIISLMFDVYKVDITVLFKIIVHLAVRGRVHMYSYATLNHEKLPFNMSAPDQGSNLQVHAQHCPMLSLSRQREAPELRHA